MPAKAALVLDDDEPVRTLLREALTSEGWLVHCATRGAVALQWAALRRPDVVLLDVSQPEYAPEALATGLRIHYGPDLPILAMSTSPKPDITARVGAFDFIQKPFELDRLFQLLARGASLGARSSHLRTASDEAVARMRNLRIMPGGGGGTRV